MLRHISALNVDQEVNSQAETRRSINQQIKNFVQKFGVKFCICNIFVQKTYDIKASLGV